MTSVAILYLVLALLAGATLLSLLADRMGIPTAVTLVVGGMALAVLPGAPSFIVEPDLILVLFLPPLLLYAAYFTVWRDFRTELRPIALLSLGAVVFTTASVGCVARLVLPSLPWAVCFTLGAIVSPPDAISARAVFRRLNAPKRMQTILEGESLVNDATGLVLYRVAVAAALSGTFSLAHAGAAFAWLTIGGIGFGVLIGRLVEILLLRLRDSRYVIVTILLSAYGSYLGAEAAHASGVLAVVGCGLLIGWRQHVLLAAEARSDSNSVWALLVFILEAFVFVLIGLSLHGILDRMESRVDAWADAVPLAIAVTATVVGSRFVWIYLSSHVSKIVKQSSAELDPSSPRSMLLIMSWCGMRGVVSLAAALALPSSFPGRDTVLFATFIVILVTVLVQGPTLGPLISALRVPEVASDGETLSFAEARVKVNVAAVQVLETLVKPDDGALAHPALVQEYRSRTRATERLRDEDQTIAEESHAHFSAALLAVAHARTELLRMLHTGEIHESVAHRIEADLDLEEMRLRRLAEALPKPEPPEAGASSTIGADGFGHSQRDASGY